MNPPRWLEQTTDAGIGCYVHLPFCDRICPYCDFAVVEYQQPRVQRYLAALGHEISARSRAAGRLQTLYFGGGTPSALSPEQIADVADALFRYFEVDAGSVEFTLEANPARNLDGLARWRAAGVNRLSIGVQSLDAGELHRLGRTHSAAEAIAFFDAARSAGFENISMDFIAGVPGQTGSSLEAGLGRALDRGVDHLSVYGLTIEAGTPYARWQRQDAAAFPDDDEVAEQLTLAHEVITGAGFAHYEISNFARPGFESAHNFGYWRQRACVAFGMSAAGYEEGVRYRNARDYVAYCTALESGASPQAEREVLSAAGRIGEAAMLALRTQRGIEHADFRTRFGVDVARVFAAATKKCMTAGLLEGDAQAIRLTQRGQLLANSVCAEFLQPELQAVTMA